ncbi:MAG: substrate-binding domain-containing protein [Planctomycetales bacterium]|nr:substrate-binding domain-containing protein [Planctomycetales bacterium]
MKRLGMLLACVLCLAVWGCGGSSETGNGGGNGEGNGGGDGGKQASNGDGAKAPIKVVAFDEDDETLQAILDGECYGTVAQQPYMYGYESVKLLVELAKGNEKAIPEGEFLNLPVSKITGAEVSDFWAKKKEYLAAGEGEAEQKEGRDTVAFITNGVDPFWTIAAAGAKAAARELDVNVALRFPPDGVEDQNRMLQTLLVQEEVSGVAVSPIDPGNQTEILNKLGEAKNYITHDSDAPETNRKAYIGVLNYEAGRSCGQLVKEAMPEGGTVMIFVGRLGQLNAEQRRQGVIDELLDRDFDPTRRDPVDAPIKGEKYTILGTMTDNFDKVKAKQNAQDAIAANPDLGCMVGLFAYNPPVCLQAVRDANREVKPQ